MDNEKLSRADALFVAEYLVNGFNGTQAWMKYHKQANANTASGEASRVLHKPEARAAIRESIEATLGQYKDVLDIRLVTTYMARAFYNPLDFVDDDGELIYDPATMGEDGAVVIDGITKHETATGSYVTYELANRDKALETLAKYVKLIKAEAGEGDGQARVILLPVAMSPEQWQAAQNVLKPEAKK